MRSGVSSRESCDMTMTRSLTDDPDMEAALRSFIEAYFEE